MKKIFFLFLLFICTFSFAQPENGAIKTKNGILMFLNHEKDSYTFYLADESKIDNFPLFLQNDKLFQIRIEEKNKMGFDPKNILNEYMKWEADHFIKTIKGIQFAYNEKKIVNKFETNFWKITFPDLKSDENPNPVKAMYFIDFVNDNKLYRIAFSSLNSDDNEAKTLLYNHVDNFKFYPNGIDFEKLIDNVKKGINHY